MATVGLADAHTLFVNVGSATNSCQAQNRRRTAAEPPQNRTNRTEANGERFATGCRNVVALDVNPRTRARWGCSNPSAHR